MSTTNRKRIHPLIDARLSTVAKSMPVAPGWYEPWLRLDPMSMGEQRLLVCEAIRDSGTLPTEAGDFLVSLIIEELTEEAMAELKDNTQAMNLREGRRASDQIFADLLEKHGQREMADRFRSDPLSHAERREAGRQFFFGMDESDKPKDSGWLRDFVEAVSSGLLTDRANDKFGVRHREEGGYWEISVYPLLVGGVGERCTSLAELAKIAWDIERLQSVFDRLDGVGWYAACPADTGSPYVWLEGEYQDHEVFLRLLPGEPDQVEPGEKCGVWQKKQS